MRYLFIFMLLFFFIKSFYYGKYEINEKQNKPGGIVVIILAILGFIFPTILLFLLY